MKVKSVSNWYIQKPSWIESIYLTLAPKLRMLIKNSVFRICKAWTERKQYKSHDIHRSVLRSFDPKLFPRLQTSEGTFQAQLLPLNYSLQRNFISQFKPTEK